MKVLLVCSGYQINYYIELMRYILNSIELYVLSDYVKESNYEDLIYISSERDLDNVIEKIDTIIVVDDGMLSPALLQMLFVKKCPMTNLYNLKANTVDDKRIDELFNIDFENEPVVLLLYEGLFSQYELIDLELNRLLTENNNKIFHYSKSPLYDLTRMFDKKAKNNVYETFVKSNDIALNLITMHAGFLYNSENRLECIKLFNHIKPDYIIYCVESGNEKLEEISNVFKYAYSLNVDTFAISNYITYKNAYGNHLYINSGSRRHNNKVLNISDKCASTIYSNIMKKIYMPQEIYQISI